MAQEFVLYSSNKRGELLAVLDRYEKWVTAKRALIRWFRSTGMTHTRLKDSSTGLVYVYDTKTKKVVLDEAFRPKTPQEREDFLTLEIKKVSEHFRSRGVVGRDAAKMKAYIEHKLATTRGVSFEETCRLALMCQAIDEWCPNKRCEVETATCQSGKNLERCDVDFITEFLKKG